MGEGACGRSGTQRIPCSGRGLAISTTTRRSSLLAKVVATLWLALGLLEILRGVPYLTMDDRGVAQYLSFAADLITGLVFILLAVGLYRAMPGSWWLVGLSVYVVLTALPLVLAFLTLPPTADGSWPDLHDTGSKVILALFAVVEVLALLSVVVLIRPPVAGWYAPDAGAAWQKFRTLPGAIFIGAAVYLLALVVLVIALFSLLP
jgi:hypothetical protein